MIVSDRFGQHGRPSGDEKLRWYHYSKDDIGPAMAFGEYVLAPGKYAGYHRHDGSGSIIYILSGTLGTFQDGERCVMEAGDALLVKSGSSHTFKGLGDVPAKHSSWSTFRWPGTT